MTLALIVLDRTRPVMPSWVVHILFVHLWRKTEFVALVEGFR